MWCAWGFGYLEIHTSQKRFLVILQSFAPPNDLQGFVSICGPPSPPSLKGTPRARATPKYKYTIIFTVWDSTPSGVQPLAHWTIVWHMVSEYVVHYLLREIERARTQCPLFFSILVSRGTYIIRRGHYDVGWCLQLDPCGILPWFQACFLMSLKVFFTLFPSSAEFFWVC